MYSRCNPAYKSIPIPLCFCHPYFENLGIPIRAARYICKKKVTKECVALFIDICP